MEQMLKSLYEAAIEGSVTRLKELIQQDELILIRSTKVTSYGETPLHIVAMIGHLDFCSELVRRNPGLIRELDSRGSSALHIASAKGHARIVNIIVSACPEMCLAYDGDGYNPIHIAAMNGWVNVLEELVKVSPDEVCGRVNTCQGGNVLHLCVQYYQMEALKFLLVVKNDHDFVNSKDEYGNSILHLAVEDKQVEIIRFLLNETAIEVNTLNSSGLTASDILKRQPKRDSTYMDIAHFPQLISGQRRTSSSSGGHHSEIHSKSGEDEHVLLDQHRNSLMVVASLIATMAFQAGVNPPSGFKPDSGLYNVFVVSNTIGFLSSLSVILLLISGLPLRHKVFTWTWTAILWISISATTCTYTVSLASMSDWTSYSIGFRIVIATWFDLKALLFLLHTIRFLSHCIQDWPFKRKCYAWLFIIVAWIIAAVLGIPVPPINPIDQNILFPIFVTGWEVSAAFLIVLYAIQMVFFITSKLKTWFKQLKSHLSPSNQAPGV
ncbi:phosphatase modulator [Lithospermum erythrorhizon]|uniref:Phosphatase modulator n=1 Tax=Lithospermum erythrorhizon TaxID=34254 RepID=A0AAV3RU39_LITER